MQHAHHDNLFEEHGSDWWNEKGVFRILHRMTPFRMMFILKHLKHFFNIETLHTLSILDVGCGGGLLCEPLARLGADVTGIDQSKTAIDTAITHAKNQSLSIHYLHQNLKDMPSQYFDVVIASEVIEHVLDQQDFLMEIARVVKKDGCVIITTLNRTIKSYLLGILAAEYVLGFAPPGTHDHALFMKPSELRTHMDKAGLSLQELQGISFNPLTGSFRWSKDLSINYFAFATCASPE